jgi:hypothetical protein
MTFLELLLLLVYGAALTGLVTATFNRSIQIGGSNSTFNLSITGEGGVSANPTVAAAKPGVLTVRTSATVGSLTMETGHGIITGQRFDMYWTKADGTIGHCYGCIAGTVAGLVVPIASTVGGDAFPVAGYAVRIGIINEAKFVADGDEVLAIIAMLGVGTSGGYAVFQQADDTHIHAAFIDPTHPYNWATGDGTSALAGVVVDHVLLSHDNVSNSVLTMRVDAVVA